ncbi:hypothetical protein ANCDUO_00862 [Ancylostoma duodenale]|uniref:Uncharacterized protein n=1 Tax=Ancylostoma duodenale TaxID=51022 RepID=A0A0C2DFN3_9BILA|nr:hypothetical protein ANCDUO_00862 [Ancylostoma duodenale]
MCRHPEGQPRYNWGKEHLGASTPDCVFKRSRECGRTSEAAVAPQHLRVWAVTPVSACVRWYPSNSNADHVVSLNAVKVGVCPPTVFQLVHWENQIRIWERAGTKGHRTGAELFELSIMEKGIPASKWANGGISHEPKMRRSLFGLLSHANE